jgi:chaperonin cofactor prefoldin
MFNAKGDVGDFADLFNQKSIEIQKDTETTKSKIQNLRDEMKRVLLDPNSGAIAQISAFAYGYGIEIQNAIDENTNLVNHIENILLPKLKTLSGKYAEMLAIKKELELYDDDNTGGGVNTGASVGTGHLGSGAVTTG